MELYVRNTPQRSKKKVMKIIIGLLLLVCLATIGLSVYVGWNLTHPKREALTQSPKDYNLAFENATFTSAHDDKIKLKGWIFEPTSGQAEMTVIYSHGYRKNRYEDNVGFLKLASAMVKENIRVVMFDYRNSGKSEGEVTSVGALEKYDLLGVVNDVKRKYNEPIAILGASMGASTTILTTALTPDVKAIVVDSPFSDLRSYLKKNMTVWTGLPDFPFTSIILAVIPQIAGFKTEDSSPINEINKIGKRPIFFIHSKDDPAIPYTESEKLASTYKGPSQIWLTEKALHVKSYSEYGAEYENKVIQFLKQNVK